jgi:hypothetical protein
MKVEFRTIKTPDQFPDLSWLQTEHIIDEDGDLHIINSDRYSQCDIDVYGQEKVLGWIREDHDRHRNHGISWHMIVVATSIYIDGEFIHDIYLGGVESDCDEDHMNAIINKNILELKLHLYRLSEKIDGALVKIDKGDYEVRNG